MISIRESLARALQEAGVFYAGVQERLEQSLTTQGLDIVKLDPGLTPVTKGCEAYLAHDECLIEPDQMRWGPMCAAYKAMLKAMLKANNQA